MTKKLARAIKTRQDYKGAVLVARDILTQPGRESAEESRLQALIREMERFDFQNGDEESADVPEASNNFPRRRWSDDEV